jgi:molybdopterin-guanine dinucleotide biosynthesis protein A
MKTAGVILAGGLSRRFGSLPKALANLAGEPLILHVIERLSPQVGLLAISVERRNPLFNTFGLEQIDDPDTGVQGPLPALLSALNWLRTKGESEWVQLVPCDLPFVPTDLVGRLTLHVSGLEAVGCVPRFRGEVQSACGLWHVSLLEAVEQAVGDGLRGFREFLERQPLAILDWPEPRTGAADPFFNINTRAHLEQAERQLGHQH